ncbi:RDD family protein [Bartonella choladocola]|uniref:RDD family protein n=1 Tax=Bartonella choladocola TaxID=2750995 RepID=UPI00350EC1B5
MILSSFHQEIFFDIVQSRTLFIILVICEYYILLLLIDILVYSIVGNNIGKLILGLRIINADTGSKLGLSGYSLRTIRQMFSGFGLGITVICFFMFLIQFITVWMKNRASYDAKTARDMRAFPGNEDISNRIANRPIGIYTTIFFIMAYVFLFVFFSFQYAFSNSMIYRPI